LDAPPSTPPRALVPAAEGRRLQLPFGPDAASLEYFDARLHLAYNGASALEFAVRGSRVGVVQARLSCLQRTHSFVSTCEPFDSFVMGGYGCALAGPFPLLPDPAGTDDFWLGEAIARGWSDLLVDVEMS
jgi:hypothetical protein